MLTGCGTFFNCLAEPKVYGGVALDAHFGVAGASLLGLYEPSQDEVSLPTRIECLATCAYFVVVDLPLSLLGDTLTLPFTLHAMLEKLSQKKSGQEASGPENNSSERQ